MQFSNTTTKEGLIQDCEQWTGLGDAAISGDATKLKVFTNYINREYDYLKGRLDTYSRTAQFDDSNHTKHNFATFPITSGEHEYTFTTDEQGNTITDITRIIIPNGSNANDTVELDRLSLADVDAGKIIVPDASSTGIPTGYIERNNTIFFNLIPNFTGTGTVFFKRVQSYFADTDTTKEPGFDPAFHEILSCGASLRWLTINKPTAPQIQLLASIKDEQTRMLISATQMRNPNKTTMSNYVPDFH